MIKRTAIIDLDSILFAAAWGNKIINPETGEYLRDDKGRLIYREKTNDEISTSLDLMLTTILEETGATEYLAFVKGKNTSRHRYQAKSDYKSNRPKESPEWWDWTRDYAVGAWKAIPVDEIEVDDAVNISRLKIKTAFIVAIDKDLLNLWGLHYNWRNKQWVTVNKIEEYYNFWQDMLIGQPGDGISGIPGIGKKTASKILNDATDLKGKVLDTYVEHYGEYKGIQEFYKNYMCLKILEEYENFEIPEPIPYKKQEDLFEGLWEEQK